MMKTLSAVVVLCAVIAAPVFAHGAGGHGQGSHRGLARHHRTAQHHVGVDGPGYFRGAYDQPNERSDPDPHFQRNIENFGFSGRDPSRIGGEDPSLHPSTY